MASPKKTMTTEFPSGNCVHPCGHVGICDHCGTVSNAVAVWTAFEIEGCECLCHKARELYKTNIAKKKKGNMA